MKVAPYLFLDGRAEEAIEYYRRALGAEVGGWCGSRTIPIPSRA
jgi:PhnB protein